MTVERRRMSDIDHKIHSILVFDNDNNIIINIIMICLRFRLGEGSEKFCGTTWNSNCKFDTLVHFCHLFLVIK